MITTYDSQNILINPGIGSQRTLEVGFLVFLLTLVLGIFAVFYLGLNTFSDTNFSSGTTTPSAEQSAPTPRRVSVLG